MKHITAWDIFEPSSKSKEATLGRKALNPRLIKVNTVGPYASEKVIKKYFQDQQFIFVLTSH